MAELFLWLTKSQGVTELERTVYTDSSGAEIVAVRGKTAGAYRNVGAFQWTPGVKALTIVFLKAVARDLKQTKTFLPLLEGGRGSLASSLDYALNKQPEWLFSMFGCDDQGNAYLRKLLFRSNSGIRRMGSVGISLNEQLLLPQSIKVYLRDVLLKDAEELDHLAQNIIDTEQTNLEVPRVLACDYGTDLEQQSLAWTLERDTRSSDLDCLNGSKDIQPVAVCGAENIYLFEQLQFPGSRKTQDRLIDLRNYPKFMRDPCPPAIVGRLVQAKHLFEELTYRSCDKRTLNQFEDWLASMVPERDWEYGRDRSENGKIVPGILTWIKHHNATDAFMPGGLYQTFIWRDRVSGEIVATATLAPDDRDVSQTYNLGGDGHFGGINVRWDLRHRGIGTYVRARLNQHITEFARCTGKAKVFHQLTFNTTPQFAEHGFYRHPVKHVQTSAFGITPLWSKQYTI